MVSNGEFVMNARATRATLPLLQKINAAIPAYAGGGIVGSPSSDIFSLLGQVTASDARSSLKSADAALASAEATLIRLRRSSKTTTEQLAAAEDRVSVDRGKRAKAASVYATSTKSLAQQFYAAAGTTVSSDGGFIANLNQLAARGFGLLATTLLTQGDSQAKTIAAQAVKWSNTSLAKLQGRLSTSASQQATEALLPDTLAITSALKTGKNPTLASIAAATGLDPSDLQSALQAMAGKLKSNPNAHALLSGLNSVGTYQQGTWGATTGQLGPQYTIVVPPSNGNPYSDGEKAAQGIQRVATVSRGRW